jgi:cell division protein FtsB
METQVSSSEEEERLRSVNATLRKRIQMLEAEMERLRRKLESTWGEA